MVKSILNLEGVQGLSKNQQKGINGGLIFVSPHHHDCGHGGPCGKGLRGCFNWDICYL